MNCEDAIARIQSKPENGEPENGPTDLDSRKAMEHVASCGDCRDALNGLEALHELQKGTPVSAPEGLFGRIMLNVTENLAPRKARYGFWHGVGIGGAVAATLIMAFMASTVMRSPDVTSTPATPEFVIAMNEARDVNIAIDAGRDLQGATVSVFLSGGVELAGFGNQREISWSTDLEQGVNQLTLPVIATDLNGGSLLVRLDHEGVQKVFKVNLKISG